PALSPRGQRPHQEDVQGQADLGRRRAPRPRGIAETHRQEDHGSRRVAEGEGERDSGRLRDGVFPDSGGRGFRRPARTLRAEGARGAATVDRSKAWAAGTPQAFRAELLARALASGAEATDEASLCEALDIPVAVIALSRLAFKITAPEDLEMAEAILARRQTK